MLFLSLPKTGCNGWVLVDDVTDARRGVIAFRAGRGGVMTKGGTVFTGISNPQKALRHVLYQTSQKDNL